LAGTESTKLEVSNHNRRLSWSYSRNGRFNRNAFSEMDTHCPKCSGTTQMHVQTSLWRNEQGRITEET